MQLQERYLIRRRLTLCVLVFAVANRVVAGDLSRSGISDRELDSTFAQTVHPFLETYCFGCHGKEKQKGKLDLRVYSTPDTVARGYRQWQVVLTKLKATEMPPEEAKAHPSMQLRQQVIRWIEA